MIIEDAFKTYKRFVKMDEENETFQKKQLV